MDRSFLSYLGRSHVAHRSFSSERVVQQQQQFSAL